MCDCLHNSYVTRISLLPVVLYEMGPNNIFVVKCLFSELQKQTLIFCLSIHTPKLAIYGMPFAYLFQNMGGKSKMAEKYQEGEIGNQE